jgi:hypothetical protein
MRHGMAASRVARERVLPRLRERWSAAAADVGPASGRAHLRGSVRADAAVASRSEATIEAEKSGHTASSADDCQKSFVGLTAAGASAAGQKRSSPVLTIAFATLAALFFTG